MIHSNGGVTWCDMTYMKTAVITVYKHSIPSLSLGNAMTHILPSNHISSMKSLSEQIVTVMHSIYVWGFLPWLICRYLKTSPLTAGRHSNGPWTRVWRFSNVFLSWGKPGYVPRKLLYSVIQKVKAKIVVFYQLWKNLLATFYLRVQTEWSGDFCI